MFGILIAWGWLVFGTQKNSRQALSVIFSRDIWLSSSAKADYAIFLINKLTFLFLAPLLLTQLVVATWLFELLHEVVGARLIIGESWPDSSVIALFTLCYFLLDDFARFYVHKLLHEVPCLWAFHKVHHSARTLTPMTVFRTHPVEGVIFALRSVIVQAIVMAVFVFFFGGRVDLFTVLGVGVFTLLFNLMGSNLRHSHVGLRYWVWLEKILISPAQHQIHHSVNPKHFDKNYGVVLAIWDRMGKSLVISSKDECLEFGLSKKIVKGEQNLMSIYFAPFKEVLMILGKSFHVFKSVFKS